MKTFDTVREPVLERVLPSGLRVLICPKKGFSRKVAYLTADFGSLHRRFRFRGQEYELPMGVAHFLEHKLFQMPDKTDISEEFAALGANVNAFTGYDMTSYHFSCTEHFMEALELLLRFVTTAYFEPESVEREKSIIAQEIAMNEDSPDSAQFQLLMENAYRHHNVREPILGTVESISGITPQILHLAHEAFYAPGNLLLTVVGDVDADAVCALANDILGDRTAPVAEKCLIPEGSTQPLAPVTGRPWDVPMPKFSFVFPLEPVKAGDFRSEWAADLACEALFGESSALYRELYEEGLIDGSFYGGFETLDGAAMVLLSGDSRDPGRVAEAVLEAARSFSLTREDLQRTARGCIGRRLRDLDSFDSVCHRLTVYKLAGIDYFAFPEVIAAVTREEVAAFAQKLTQEHFSACILTPMEE